MVANKVAPKKVVAKKVATKKVVAEEDATKKVVAKKIAPKKVAASIDMLRGFHKLCDGCFLFIAILQVISLYLHHSPMKEEHHYHHRS